MNTTLIDLPGHRLGLLSESHADADITRQAVSLLISEGIDAILHLGDICSDAVLDQLAGLPVPTHALAGNMDADPRSLARYAHSLSIHLHNPAARFLMADNSILAHHGHLPEYEALALSTPFDFFFHGHTHIYRNEQIAQTHIINPGALHRAPQFTIAIVDFTTPNVQKIIVTPGS